jgi:tol-pal system protein YbgF
VRRIVLFLALAALMAASAPASAQYSGDNSALYDRINQLESEIQSLQAQISRGGGGSTTVINSPALGGGMTTSSTAPSPMPSGSATGLDYRMSQMEEQVRQLTGKVEEATYKAEQTAKQLERMQADIDLRFKELQGGGAAAAAPDAMGAPPSSALPSSAPPPAANANAPLPIGKNVNVGGNSAAGNGLAPGPQTLGTISQGDLKREEAAVAAAPPAMPTDPKALYQDAYEKARKGDYPGAEAEFKAFLAKYPTHALAANASYWLADMAFTRKDYKQAMGLFGDAYKKYPKSDKAPDMLYKLGASFANIDPPMKNEACTAFSYLFQNYPDMPERVRRLAGADRQRLNCK